MDERARNGELSQGGPCRVCQTPLEAGTLRCTHCGAVHGEGFRCPHCRAIADVEQAADGTQRCKACGGPRLLIDDGKLKTSGREARALRDARHARSRASLWKATAVGLGAFGALGLVAVILLLALTSPGVMLGALALALGSLPLLAALSAQQRSKTYARTRDRSAHEAELSVTRDLAETKAGEITAAELARRLSLPEPHAELLLAELSLQDVVQRRVTESGELSYRTPARVRVSDASHEAPGLEPEATAEPELARAEKSEGS